MQPGKTKKGDLLFLVFGIAVVALTFFVVFAVVRWA
jgi:hypothetical protein